MIKFLLILAIILCANGAHIFEKSSLLDSDSGELKKEEKEWALDEIFPLQIFVPGATFEFETDQFHGTTKIGGATYNSFVTMDSFMTTESAKLKIILRTVLLFKNMAPVLVVQEKENNSPKNLSAVSTNKQFAVIFKAQIVATQLEGSPCPGILTVKMDEIDISRFSENEMEWANVTRTSKNGDLTKEEENEVLKEMSQHFFHVREQQIASALVESINVENLFKLICPNGSCFTCRV